MTNKRKKRVKSIRSKTGLSHQGALNQLNKASEVQDPFARALNLMKEIDASDPEAAEVLRSLVSMSKGPLSRRKEEADIRMLSALWGDGEGDPHVYTRRSYKGPGVDIFLQSEDGYGLTIKPGILPKAQAEAYLKHRKAAYRGKPILCLTKVPFSDWSTVTPELYSELEARGFLDRGHPFEVKRPPPKLSSHNRGPKEQT